MKRIAYILTLAVAALICVSCEVDNYTAPDAALSGTVIDATTGKGIVTEAGYFNIRHKEISEEYPTAPERTFSIMADGNFRDTKLFPVTYEVWPADGPFVPFEASQRQKVTLNSGKEQTLSFTVTPYASVKSFSVTKSGTTANITFTFTKNVGTILDYRVFATDKTPLVGPSITDGVGGNAVNLDDSAVNTPVTITTERTGFVAGGKYWIRIGVRCKEAPSQKYNMSEVVEVQF